MVTSPKKTPLPLRILLLLATCLLQQPTSQAIDFKTDIQPLLAENCVRCHGPEKQKGGLRLDSPMFIQQGGDSGEPVLIPGNSSQSHIIQLVSAANPADAMPPNGPPLPAQQIQLLQDWITAGAPMPETETETAHPLTTDHWSLQPLQHPTPPNPQTPSATNPIDAFIQAKLSEHQLQPSPAADRTTLIRRLYLILHGLPPTPAEVEAFTRDTQPDAYERLVDRILASPRYGERWARHWLDVVRYADSNGFETNRERKTAYPYRDYVIASFNEDKPYDQFIREQLAGDAYGIDAATGFLVAGPYDIVKSPDPNLTLTQRQNELDDMINTTGTAFLGLTLGCARCHNHKFDPIPQKDYYALQAVFAGVQHGDRPLRKKLSPAEAAELGALKQSLSETQNALEHYRNLARKQPLPQGNTPLREAVNHHLNHESFPPVPARAVRFTIHATTGSSEPCIDELEILNSNDLNVALSTNGAIATASGTLPGYEAHKLEHINDGRYGNDRSWISNTPGTGWIQIELPETQTITEIRWGRDRNNAFKDRLATRYTIETSTNLQTWTTIASSDSRLPYNNEPDPNAFLTRLSPAQADAAKALQEQIATTQTQINQLRGNQMVWAGTFSQPETTRRLYRGDPLAPREPVAPDTLSALGTLGLAMNAPEQQRRIQLANWIANPQNPLTARVLVNRLWHYTFGTGIVPTPSDLGANGIPPTHPELLDWLATEFIHHDWSIKHVLKLILTSHTFQQSSRPTPNGIALDASSSLLWRFPPRRLEAEAIRDSILAVSGDLDLTMGGPGFYLHEVEVENVMHYHPKEEFSPAEFRRMVYLFKIRQEQDAIFGAFDCPDGNQVIPQRSRSNTPLQALNLFNSPFTLQQANTLASRLQSEAGPNPNEQTSLAFQLAFARNPDDLEQASSSRFIAQQGLPAFCRALFNTSEFLFVF